MTPARRCIESAIAFEEARVDDDWSRLEPCVAGEAIDEVRNAPFACTLRGRAAILRGLEKALDPSSV